ncbi:hypothetical protein AGLY_001262, partial [Aphis glycines]
NLYKSGFLSQFLMMLSSSVLIAITPSINGLCAKRLYSINGSPERFQFITNKEKLFLQKYHFLYIVTKDSIGAPIVNMVVYTDSKSPPKLQFKYSNIVVTLPQLINKNVKQSILTQQQKFCISIYNLPFNKIFSQIWLTTTCNKSSTSLRLVTFNAGVLNFLLRKHAIARPKYIRRSLKYNYSGLLANDARTSAASL